MTATEALWKGTPVVATRVGGLKTQVEDGKNGYLVEPQDYENAAEKVLTILSENEKSKSMGVRAKRTVKENFLITRLMERWIDLWRDLLL